MNVTEEDILDFDLTLYEYGKGTLVGLDDEFISSGRLDDLAMVHARYDSPAGFQTLQ